MPSGRDRLLHAVLEHFAEHGVGNQSLRSIAAAIGTSHRMLIYHFGSREGLLAAVVEAVESRQHAALTALLENDPADLRTTVLHFWSHLSDEARRYGPIVFELSAHAMQGHPHAARLTDVLVEPWLDTIAEILARAGFAPQEARERALLGLATVRGLLHDALLTGDFAAADAAAVTFTDMLLARAPSPSSPTATS